MNKKNHITTLAKRDVKTRSYKMDMDKKDLKRLSKLQLIKLLLKQEAKKQIPNEFENSIASLPNQEESVPHNSVNDYEDIILPPPEQFWDRKKKRRPPKPTRKPPLPPLSKDPFNFDDDIFQTKKPKP